MQKWWSIFFGVVLTATFGLWVAAPFVGWWLPANVASYGDQVDDLFYVILGFTGFFFILTEVILVYVMWRYTHRPGHKADYTHGNHKLEIFWTAVPAAILLFIAFAQVKAWENIKYQSRMPPPDLTVQVTARQWEWRMRYPYETSRFNYSPDAEASQVQVMQREARRWAEVPEFDDILVANELHVWQGANVKIYLKTLDVIHSFYLPNLRLKQDALPGKTIPMWFRATASNTVRLTAADGTTPLNEWLGNKDPQKWREEQKLVRKLLDEAGKREQLEAKEKAAGTAKGDAASALNAEVVKLLEAVKALEAERKARGGDLAKLETVADLRREALKLRDAGDPGHSWEIACAELCGARHAYMRGRLYVHPTQPDFEAWLAHTFAEQRRQQP